jgi:hypothetical protein
VAELFKFDNPYQAYSATDNSGYDPWQVYNATMFTPQAPMNPWGLQTQATAMNPWDFQFKPPSGEQLLANDPGYAFRMSEGQKALEASAAARGGLFSGATGKALTDYSQNLASQEYDKAWNRALGMNQLDYTRALQQDQDLFSRGLATTDRAYDRALRYDTDAFNRSLLENQLNYDRLSQADALGYGRAQQQSQDEYLRGLEEYKTNLASQLGLRQQAFNELSSLAGLGQTTNSLLANLGANLGTQQGNNILSGAASNAAGQVGASSAWGNALSGLGGAGNSALQYMLLNQLMGR